MPIFKFITAGKVKLPRESIDIEGEKDPLGPQLDTYSCLMDWEGYLKHDKMLGLIQEKERLEENINSSQKALKKISERINAVPELRDLKKLTDEFKIANERLEKSKENLAQIQQELKLLDDPSSALDDSEIFEQIDKDWSRSTIVVQGKLIEQKQKKEFYQSELKNKERLKQLAGLNQGTAAGALKLFNGNFQIDGKEVRAITGVYKPYTLTRQAHPGMNNRDYLYEFHQDFYTLNTTKTTPKEFYIKKHGKILILKEDDPEYQDHMDFFSMFSSNPPKDKQALNKYEKVRKQFLDTYEPLLSIDVRQQIKFRDDSAPEVSVETIFEPHISRIKSKSNVDPKRVEEHVKALKDVEILPDALVVKTEKGSALTAGEQREFTQVTVENQKRDQEKQHLQQQREEDKQHFQQQINTSTRKLNKYLETLMAQPKGPHTGTFFRSDQQAKMRIVERLKTYLNSIKPDRIFTDKGLNGKGLDEILRTIEENIEKNEKAHGFFSSLKGPGELDKNLKEIKAIFTTLKIQATQIPATPSPEQSILKSRPR